MASDDRQQFMTIGAAPGQTKSFEEVRVDDYLKAYMTTGGPPQPCTQEPASDVARAALGLPPLFQPYSASPPGGSGSTSSASGQPAPSTTNPLELPPAQEFTPLKIDTETYHSIVASAQYAFFNPVELRYYAYLRGAKTAPLGIKMDPFVISSTTASGGPVPSTPGGDPREKMQSISAQPLFAEHNFEELRIAYMLSGRELNSTEVRQFLNQPASSSTAVPPPAPTTPAPPAPTVPFLSTPSISSGLPGLAAPQTPSFSFKWT